MADAERLICASEALTERGAGVRFEVVGRDGPLPAFAVRVDGVVRAYLNRCTHLPVELDWNPGDFFDADRQTLICAMHGAEYDPVTGHCLGGPGRGALAAITVIERAGQVFLVESPRPPAPTTPPPPPNLSRQ